jgi:hypothetical protein
MRTAPHSKEKTLSGKQIHARVVRRLKKYDDLTYFEQVALFIGKAQLLEAALKQLLVTRYGCPEGKAARWSLGRTISELKTRGLRPDFVKLLEELNYYRNYAAHDLLADHAIMTKIVRSFADRETAKWLFRSLYTVEQTVIVYDFLARNEFFDAPGITRQP